MAEGESVKCSRFFKGSNPIKIVLVMLCVGLVVQQISVCIMKLIDIPVTTYTHFDFNKTITYPSITLCREPPYKQDKLLEYGLYSHPILTSAWRNFNFSSIFLDDLWEEITYNDEDFFVQYALDSVRDNVEVTSTMTFMHGRCYTLSPRDLSREAEATIESGYSIMVQHNKTDLENPITLKTPGYYVFVHYVREPFTEVDVFNGGLVDQLYVNTGETLTAKLKVDEYVKINDDEDPCSRTANYSASVCTTQYVSDEVVSAVNCSGPWMNSDRPYCNNFQDMRNLISTYYSLYKNHNSSTCPRLCHSYLYNVYVTDRQKFYYWDTRSDVAKETSEAALQTQLYFYFNSMMVSVFEEKYNYDWNVFLADLGGSVGFLLGLSVIGLINIIGRIWITIEPLICKKHIRDEDKKVDGE
ncbi:uncharacterized protein LOC116770221 [Danaus plexippus]|uniref:uncharacterized protein LOC116770221 n=1 Tax=Danaus plexippus TaxID=13037 RepID=UPI002AB1EDCC|nr:uncharacterized protein LOC116770221 [Danaus plexippus]